MPEQILPDLYRIKIPLRGSPLKALNSYLIKSRDRFLIIDTGWNRDECRQEMLSELAKLDVDLRKTDFFLTHMHADHSGLTADLATDTSKVYINYREAGLLNVEKSQREINFQTIMDAFLANGFPEAAARNTISGLPGRQYWISHPLDFTPLQEGDKLEFGEFTFLCIETPGHSPGHMCLYDAKRKVLVAGDHILYDITPNITFWSIMKDSLAKYLASLEKVYILDVELVLTGHRSIVENHRGRVDELRRHHRARLDEITAALSNGARNAFEIAPQVSWDIISRSWEEFPPVQKWFAFGETLAHVLYLEQTGTVRGENVNGQRVFSLT